MFGQTVALAKSDLPWPPSVEDFYLPSILPWGEHNNYWITKITLMVWLAVGVLIIYFLLSYRNPQLVPTKKQWIAESLYGFVRNNIAVDMIGHRGVAFAPYFTTLFSFILLTNLFGIIPFFQISPNSHIAFPAFMALISYAMFIWVGMRHHGFGKYWKHALIPPAPGFILPILIPIELASTFVFRPLTLALRLFANMFAGHIILLVFTVGGFVLLNAQSVFVKPVSVISWIMAIALTFLEALIAVLQAYVFVVLTASYVQGAVADEH
ncbi:F0F1 ATP synthase subunit A [Plantactinospora sp. KBS50]|uniref:F0F1 ATP synthase subunit A n=1 Tax=Plantactinospora sp. KBS50 TaxID=2024580 RepID=UPI000BAA9E0C|nr:F0F1 ATP synthase subunit A [Plantactinospora sp. KBS50]ASW56455.1 ATP synthase F0 subunit A [Plantactinospora sp. KBS50]